MGGGSESFNLKFFPRSALCLRAFDEKFEQSRGLCTLALSVGSKPLDIRFFPGSAAADVNADVAADVPADAAADAA